MYWNESFLDSLLEADRDALLKAGRSRQWQQGELLLRAGDRADAAIVVLEGLVKIHNTAADGSEVILALTGPGELLGETSAVLDRVRSASATALESVEGLVIPVGSFRSFLADHQHATEALLDLALGRLHVSDIRLVEFATSDSLGRVTSRLIELAERFGTRRDGGEIELALPITQEELAHWSASSLESMARALRTLRALGLIQTDRRRLVVRDLDRLRQHSAAL